MATCPVNPRSSPSTERCVTLPPAGATSGRSESPAGAMSGRSESPAVAMSGRSEPGSSYGCGTSPPRFHTVRGAHVLLSTDRRCAYRAKRGAGLLFSSRPVAVGQQVKTAVHILCHACLTSPVCLSLCMYSVCMCVCFLCEIHVEGMIATDWVRTVEKAQ